MSDGNFNRALLPHTPLESGLKMGKAMARKAAIDAFRTYISHFEGLDVEAETEKFLSLLSEKL